MSVLLQVGDSIACAVYDVEAGGVPLLTQRLPEEADDELAELAEEMDQVSAGRPGGCGGGAHGAAVMLNRQVARRRLVGFAGGQDSSSCADRIVTCNVRGYIKVARKYTCCTAGSC